MEPRYYGQDPFRGCSLMVKPQSSKLITRVRFPSSPRTIPPTLSGGFFVLGVDGNRLRAKIHSLARSGFSPSSPSSPREGGGNPFRTRIYFLARSESARSSSSSPPQIPLKVAGNRFRASGRKYIPSRARDFHPPAHHPLTAHPHKTPYKTTGDRGVCAQWK